MRRFPPDALAAIARGRPVRLEGVPAEGKAPAACAPEPQAPAAPAVFEIPELEKMADALAVLSEKVGAAIEVVGRNARAVEESSERVSADLERVATTLAMPVRPVYSKDGKIIGAKRVGQLEGT